MQSFRIIRADDEHGGLACVGQAGSKNAAPGGVGDIGGAQGRDFLEEPPCIRRIEVLFGIRGAHGRDQRPGLFARTIGIGGVWRAVWGRSKNSTSSDANTAGRAERLNAEALDALDYQVAL